MPDPVDRLHVMRRFEVEVCNVCGGLVGWEMVREGVCLGGVVCRRESGTRMVPQPPEGAVEALARIERLREDWGEDWQAIGRAAWREAHDYSPRGSKSP